VTRLLPLFFLLLASAAHADEGRPLLLVLADERAKSDELSSDSFVLALMLHLKADNVDIQLSKWSTPDTLDDQEVLAGHRCSKSKAAAVTWYSVTGQGESAQVTVHVVSFKHGAFQRQSMKMGAPQPGIERSMALSVRTLVSAHVTRAPEPVPEPKPPPPAPPPPAPPAAPAPEPARIQVGVSYHLDIYPLGDEVRHGPTALADLRLVRDLYVRLGLGYRITEDGTSKLSWWARDFLTVDLALAHYWRLTDRLEITGNGHLRGTVVFVRAARLHERLEDSAKEWELGLGLGGGVRVKLWSLLSASFGIRLAWLPVAHQVTVGGLDVADPGAFEATMGVGIQAGVW